ncbi:MAG: hypothetical protein RL380_1722 [Verrucomicrobiota bacterium]
MKKRQLIRIFVLISVLITAAAFLPVEDHLAHPQKAIVQFDEGLQIPIRLSVWWYDQRLNTHRFGKMLDFDAQQRAQLPETPIPTRLWRLGLKRVLTRFGKWTECENCYGPNVRCALRLKGDYKVSKKMRLVQNDEETNGIITFRVSLIPDESKHETREFNPVVTDSLLTEARKLIAEGSASNIPSRKWGLELTKINPVRVECRYMALLIWMGGKVGFVIVPDSTSCPAFNMVFISGTEHPHVFKLEKI